MKKFKKAADRKPQPEKPTRTVPLYLIVFLLCFLLGIFIGYLFPELQVERILLLLIFAMLSFYAAFVLQIILHESGHLVFGTLTGYRFVSFRIFSLTIVKKGTHFEWKRSIVPGTGGQCLMEPPDWKHQPFPYKLYNLGGVIFNLFTSLAALVLLVKIELPLAADFFFGMLFISGLLTALTNAIPRKINGMPNDGYNLKLLAKDDETKKAFYRQLKVAALSAKGIRYREMDPSLFSVHHKNGTNTIQTTADLLMYFRYLDDLQLEQAEAYLDKVLAHPENLIPYQKHQLTGEKLFLESIRQKRPSVIEMLTDELGESLKVAVPYDLGGQRVRIAYEGLYRKNIMSAMDHYKQFEKIYPLAPFEGDARMEKMLVQHLKNRILALESESVSEEAL